MSRNYRSVRPRVSFVYSVDDAMKLYDVCRNTVSNWVVSGIASIDELKPQLFRGSELSRFHNERRRRTITQLRSGEFKCVGCKAVVYPHSQTLEVRQTTTGKFLAQAICPDCDSGLFKLVNKDERDRLRLCRDTNTSLVLSDESEGLVPAHVGSCEIDPLLRGSGNDRVLYDWLSYARRYDTKTIDAHMASIRAFEAFHRGKFFGNISSADCDRWRQDLISRAKKPSAEGGLSRSTVRHHASHIKAYFTWLSTRKGFTHLVGAAEYFALPRGLLADGGRDRPRAYPTLVEAAAMLDGLPSATLLERRDRAIFALAFVTALRESALISLRVRHIDLQRKQAFHEGGVVRSKNGKTFTVDFFPRTEQFQVVFRAWYAEMIDMGFRGNDALFPSARTLEKLWRASEVNRSATAPMNSASAVDAVFRKASMRLNRRYSPHSARHTIVQLGDQICRTPEERKAWSLNMGHSSESITWQHYGRVSSARKSEIFGSFDLVEHWPEEDMRLMLLYHEHRLHTDSHEFRRAEALVERSKAIHKSTQ